MSDANLQIYKLRKIYLQVKQTLSFIPAPIPFIYRAIPVVHHALSVELSIAELARESVPIEGIVAETMPLDLPIIKLPLVVAAIGHDEFPMS